MIYYAVFYSTKDSGRVENYAGEDKVDYICRTLNGIGEDVIILSNAKTNQKKFAPKQKLHLFNRTDLIYFSSLPRINLFVHAVDVLWGYMQLVFFVLKSVKKDDTIIVYHSLGYRGIWGILKKIRKFNYILEVEEIYGLFKASTSNYSRHEREVFAYPDAFMFSNSLLEEEVNVFHKPFLIINGVYENNLFAEKTYQCEEVKVVYAGSLEEQKGVDYIISSALFLPEKYRLSIIGFGSEKDVVRVKMLISKICDEGGKVSYDGVLKGKEYTDYLQACDIGVCVQDENDEFNKYEYPSKIFSYLSNGLSVVTNKLIQLEKSDVYPFLNIAKSKEPSDIAEAIVDCSKSNISSSFILNELDVKFRKDIIRLIRR